MGQTGGWRARVALAVTALALGASLVAAAPARAATTDEARFFALTNALRASVGVAPLAEDASLTAIARTWAAHMAAAGTISHNVGIGSLVTGWAKLDENVGMGTTVDLIEQALVASPDHYVNLVDPQVTLLGVGAVTSGTTVFVVEDFMGRATAPGATTSAATGAAASPPPATAPPTTAARAPAARPTSPATTPTTTGRPASPVATPTTAAADPIGPDAAAGPSPWMALALQLTRGWAPASG